MKIKVMAVDDEAPVLQVLKLLLERNGCEVVGIVDSREAADRICAEKFDGLFVDVRMPHIDGFEVTRLTRESKLNRLVPIVMLSGLDDAVTMRKGFQAGVNFFLGKPFTRERVYNLFLATRGPMAREKQRYARIPLNTTVDCTWGPNLQGQFKSSTRNISEGGMMLSPSGGLEVGTSLTLRFSLPDVPKPLKLSARVASTVPPSAIGVQFESLTEGDKEAILHYITVRMDET